MNPHPTPTGAGDPGEHADARAADPIELHTFFPYLVRVYYRAVSESIRQVYGSRYGLSVSEWRTMVVLGPQRTMSASEIVAYSSMDKVNVSRAIKGLREAGYLRRDIDGEDRRRAVARLTEEGARVLAELTPLVREREARLLEGLSDGERAALVALMEKVRVNAEAQLR